MALKNTINTMRDLLEEMCGDLTKAESGNRAAAQRVRTSSIKFAKVSKTYRKESIAEERKSSKKPSKSKAPAAKKAPAKKKKK